MRNCGFVSLNPFKLLFGNGKKKMWERFATAIRVAAAVRRLHFMDAIDPTGRILLLTPYTSMSGYWTALIAVEHRSHNQKIAHLVL
jgi:hypothetical protein